MIKTIFPQNHTPEPKAQKAQQNSHMTHGNPDHNNGTSTGGL